jgi:aryl carrier-like protein
VLNVSGVGVHDNFFSLGGDSIHSIQVTAKAKRAGLELTSALLFRHPTIAGLAAALEQNDGLPGGPDAPVLPQSASVPVPSALAVADFPEGELSPEDLERIMRKLG